MENAQSFHSPINAALLTGAGFTKSFDGYLASEMWAAIFNQPEIQNNPKLRTMLLENLDYEFVYGQVLSPIGAGLEYTEEEKKALKTATLRAYAEMHTGICSQDTQHGNLSMRACREFVSRFAGSKRTRGFIFTLNQDLFIEEYFSAEKALIVVPGIRTSEWYNRKLGSKPEGHKIRLPDQHAVDQTKEKFLQNSSDKFVYVKIHGSYLWTSHTGEDVMVIGHAKSELIDREPLLKWYLSLFQGTLNYPKINLVVIGYGFLDKHINDVIADAMRDNGLKLHVISPQQPRDFKNMLIPLHSFTGLLGAPRGQEIWDGLFSYYHAQVTEFYRWEYGGLTSLGQRFFSSFGIA